jgi:hypothetical protein
MSYIVQPRTETWEFINRNHHTDRNLGVERREHFRNLYYMNGGDLTIAILDRETDAWTKHHDLFGFPHEYERAADVHRQILKNEMVIESDLPTFEENAEATRVIGAMLERRGFTPHYYYSGGKSIHVHVYIDWQDFASLDKIVGEKLSTTHTNAKAFQKKFIEWLRAMAITCWGTHARVFDEQLAKGAHLIRAELSKNRHGYKTFLGYTYRDIPPFPLICNEETNILPRLGEIRLSHPPLIQELVEEYLAGLDKKTKKLKEARKMRSLNDFAFGENKGMLPCVAYLLSDKFKESGDGYRRAMFYIACEVKRQNGDVSATLLDWDARMGGVITAQDIEYITKNGKDYTLGHDTVHTFLRSLNIDGDTVCKA